MMKIPKPKTTLKRSRPKRSHLPSLSKIQRDLLALEMQADARIPNYVNQAVMASFNAAANRDSETPEVVIQTLDEPEKQIALLSMQGYAQTFNGIAARGRNKLMMDSELDTLIQQEADDD
jgi:hypothetical protein